MKNKSLLETNPYLKDPAKRRLLLYTSVQSSTAIEGVHTAVAKALKTIDKENKLLITSDGEESNGERK